MKNIILSSIIFIISLITIRGQSNTKIEPSNKQSFYNYYMIHSNYIGKMDFTNDARIIISSKKELDEYTGKYDNKRYEGDRKVDGKLKTTLSKYDEEFFKTKSLALAYVELSSGSDNVILKEPSIKDNTIKISYDIDSPKIGTCDMSGYVIVVEIDKNITEIN